MIYINKDISLEQNKKAIGLLEDYEKFENISKEQKDKFKDDENIDKERWKKFRNYKEGRSYKDLLNELLLIQGFVCCYCGSRVTNESLSYEIEHVKPKTKFPKKALSFENLLVCCKGGSRDIIHIAKLDENKTIIAQKYGLLEQDLEEIQVKLNDIIKDLEKKCSNKVIDKIKQKIDLNEIKEGDRILISIAKEKEEQHCGVKKGKKEITLSPLNKNVENIYYTIEGEVKANGFENDIEKILNLNTTHLRLIRKRRISNIQSNILPSIPDDIELNFALRKLIDDYKSKSESGEFEPYYFVNVAILEGRFKNNTISNNSQL